MSNTGMQQSHATPAPAGSGADVTSILTQMHAMQSEKEMMSRELAEAREKLNTLQEGKREEMKKIFDSIITKWLNESVKDEEARKQFSDGMQRLVTETREKNGVWTVAVEASALHARQAEELERLRVECDALRAHAGSGVGQFKDESARKRGRDAEPAKVDFWEEFEGGARAS